MRRIVLALGLLTPLAGAQDGAEWFRRASEATDPGERVELFTKAITSGDLAGRDLASAFVNRGAAWIDRGDLERAESDFGEAIRHDAALPAAWLGRGLARTAAGRHGEAIEDFDRLLRLEPKNEEGLLQRAAACLRAGKVDRGMRDLDRAIAGNPQSARAFAMRGEAWLGKGRLDRAAEDLDRSIAIDPVLATSWVVRAQVRRRRGDHDGALADLERARAIDEGSRLAVQDRAITLLCAGRFGEALADLDSLVVRSDTPAEMRPYHALYRWIARARSGEEAAATEQLARTIGFVGDAWPRAAADLFLGKGTPEAVLAAAGDSNERLCEAHCYIGHWNAVRGDADLARESFAACVATKVEGFFEHQMAAAELARR